VATVIIPAHNEGRVIGSLLALLMPVTEKDRFEIIVVANGCTDNTVEIASAFNPGVRVLNLPAASKHAAMVAGSQAAVSFPVIYLDADVELGADDVRALAAAVQQPGVLASGPRRVLALAGSPWPVRWYYHVWTRLPEVEHGLFGRGVIAVSKPGQERIARLPRLLGDDHAASRCFAPHERQIVTGATVTVHPPRAFGDLLRRRVRVAQGVAQFERSAVSHLGSARTRVSDLATMVRRDPGIAPRVAVFLTVAMLARMRARSVIARGDYSTWLRDESSRG
jgi:glycosyltransferase involved in cell wall biosynthesis